MDVEETARVWGPGGVRRRGSHHVGGAGAATRAAPGGVLLEPLPMPEILKHYQSIPAERLKNPADGDWPMMRRTYDGWGYSPLDQINTGNVQRLRPAWVFSTSMENGHEAPPVVVNGVMFVATPGNQVLAINARTGTLLWRYRRPLPTPVVLLHPTSRGVAVYNDKVYFAAGEAVLVALDAKTGEEVWTTRVADNESGYYMSLAPLVADGKVLIGTSGGELGIRGYVSAFDAETGKELWKTYMVPAPGEPGSETWPKGEEWKTGGGSVWVTANYDPATNLSFWGTGNGGPWMGDRRPGDNLYIASTVAIDVATGQIKGHMQYSPNESWDWDEVSPPILIDYQRGGRTIKGLVNVARNGILYFLERTAGPINFVEAMPFVRQNVFRGFDPKTGRPDVDPAKKPGTDKMADFCPSWWGGKNWPPAAFNPKTRMLYIPANENLCSTIIGRQVDYVKGRSYTGATSTLYVYPGATHIRRSAGLERRHRQACMDAHVCEVRELGADPHDRRRARVLGRHQRPDVPRVRREERENALGNADELGHYRRTDVVFGRRETVRGRAVGLRHRLARDAGAPQSLVPRRIS